MKKNIDKIIDEAFKKAGFSLGRQKRGDIAFKKKMALHFRERGCTYEEIRVALNYKSIGGVQRILGLHK